MRLAALAFAFPTCRALPPPPTAVGHADVGAPAVGTTTAMVIVGVVAASDGTGWGAGLRVERQVTTKTAVAVEIAGGKGDEPLRANEAPIRHSLLALRVAGRWRPTPDTAALAYGAGISRFSTGLVTGSLLAGAILAPSNTDVIPVFHTGVALAVPLVRGKPYGLTYEPDLGPIFSMEHDRHADRDPDEVPPREPELPRTELYFWGGFTIIGALGDSGNRLSLDFDFVRAILASDTILAASAAEAQRFTP